MPGELCISSNQSRILVNDASGSWNLLFGEEGFSFLGCRVGIVWVLWPLSLPAIATLCLVTHHMCPWVCEHATLTHTITVHTPSHPHLIHILTHPHPHTVTGAADNDTRRGLCLIENSAGGLNQIVRSETLAMSFYIAEHFNTLEMEINRPDLEPVIVTSAVRKDHTAYSYCLQLVAHNCSTML